LPVGGLGERERNVVAMPAEFGILYSLWDFAADEGRLLEQAAGEVGIEHVTVPVVTGAQTCFRTVSASELPHFQTEGGWHYRTSTQAYSGIALSPYKARWTSGADLLAQLRTQAAALGVRLMLRVDIRSVRPLVDQERHLCQRNAWGQEVPSAGGCPCNPDLRELLRATLADLTRYEPVGFELLDWAPDIASDRAAARPLNWNREVRRLLDICFCASCRQIAARAGLDADQVARTVRVTVHHLLTKPQETPAPEEDPLVTAYVAARAADCSQWLQRLAETDGERLRLLVHPLGEPALGHCPPWVRMTQLLPGHARSMNGPAGTACLQTLTETPALALPVWRPTFADAAELVRLVSEAARAGVSLFDFEGLSEAAPEAVVWLKQAVRYARRS